MSKQIFRVTETLKQAASMPGLCARQSLRELRKPQKDILVPDV